VRSTRKEIPRRHHFTRPLRPARRRKTARKRKRGFTSSLGEKKGHRAATGNISTLQEQKLKEAWRLCRKNVFRGASASSEVWGKRQKESCVHVLGRGGRQSWQLGRVTTGKGFKGRVVMTGGPILKTHRRRQSSAPSRKGRVETGREKKKKKKPQPPPAEKTSNS